MKKLKVLRKMSYQGSVKKRGEIITVGNNEAHAMIESGVARLFVDENKTMFASKRKGYKVKQWL